MADTKTIQVNETWQKFFSTIESSFSFSNQGPYEVYVRESVNQPAVQETGYIFMPSKGGAGKVELSPFWVRTKSGNSIFHFGEVNLVETFLPDKLNGLELWLDADDASTITEMSGLVSNWSYKNSSGDATQTTGALQPLTGVSTLGGLNALSFDGLNDYLIGSSGFNLSLASHTIFFAFHPAAAFLNHQT